MNKIILLAVVLVGGCIRLPRADAEIHLIPTGYVGWVTIAFRAANGEAPKYEGDARLYRIPSSGVLITRAAPNVGSSPPWRFFFEDPKGTRTPIVRFDMAPADPAVGISYMSRGSLQGVSCDIAFDRYFVGTKAQLLSAVGHEPEQRSSAFLAANYRC